MNRLWLIAGLCTLASIGVSACSETPRATQADDISPIDGHKLRAFNTWLDEQKTDEDDKGFEAKPCLLYTSPSPRDATLSRMPSSA